MRRSRWLAAAAIAGCLIAGVTTATAAATPVGSGCASARGAVVPTAADAAASPNGMLAEALHRHVTWLTTLSCTATGIRHDPKVVNGLVSSNWSGYQVTQHANYAQAGWTVPTVTAPVPGYSTRGYYSSTWAGIGGGFNAGSGALIQAGTTQDVAANGATTYYAWYEIVGGTGDTGSEQRINNLPVHPGDVVGGVGLYTASGAQAGVCNFTLGTCISVPLASSPAGTTAEWIVEAPYSGGVLPLANFHNVTFVNACWAPVYVQGGSCSTIAAGGPQAISLQANVLGGLQTLAIPGSLTADGGGFTDSYYQPRQLPPPCGGPGQPRCP
jgi:hypothetical protein